MSKKYYPFCLALLLALCFFAGGSLSLLANQLLSDRSSAANAESSAPCILLDAGHGANDPGKIGIDHTLEKDINLLMVQRLSSLLSNKGYHVVMTRQSDNQLSDGYTIQDKRTDMQHRLNIARNNSPVLMVSIHQNSYTDSHIAGAQVFYYSKSSAGKQLAQSIQSTLNEELKEYSACAGQLREIKANSDYFLLKKIPTPTVIVECGFLSNPDETALLNTDSYRDRLVRAIYLGIMNYIYQMEDVPNS